MAKDYAQPDLLGNLSGAHYLVAASRLTFAVLIGLFCLRCSLGESDLEKAAKEFRALHGDDGGIVHISPADRFGEYVITVRYISKEDYKRLSVSLPNYFKGFQVRLSGPMWGVGGLTPDSADTKKLETWFQTPPYNIAGTPANKEREKLADKVEAADSAVWTSMDKKERKAFLAVWIRKERARGLTYSNCGDKFLLPD